MEIFTGLQNYDFGFLIYDLWQVIGAFFLCTLIFLLSYKTGGLKTRLRWNSSDYWKLFVVIVLVLVVINFSSILIKIALIAAVFIVLFFLKQKVNFYVATGLCLLLGFGLTTVPLIIALGYAVFGYFRNKSIESKG